MSFRLKIVLMTVTLIVALYGVGGAVLVHTTFHASLEKEEQMAVDSNELILRIVQFVGEEGNWFSEAELISVINNICSQESIDSLELVRGENTVFTYQNEENIIKYANSVTEASEDQVLITYFTTENGVQYLQTTTKFELNSNTYYLDMGRNLSYIYEVRQEQTGVYQKMFLLLFAVGEILSWGLATFLTRSFRRLTKASEEIGGGNLSYRSRICSDDEIGALSNAFDQMAETLENNITLLKEAAEQKELFMGAFTHELKTPMTSIIGYSDLLRTQKLSEKDKAEAIEYIFTEAKRLENLSLKMLDLIVADQKEFVLKPCSPIKLTQYVTKHLQNTYKKYGVSIFVNGENGDCLLEPDLFQTLLINLLDNAKKSMEQGGKIEVNVKMTVDGCFVSVSDQGAGIPENALVHLTEAFYRVDKARARSLGNAGLGLALCEKIVQLHRGKIQFESTEGVGTTVMIWLNGGRNEENKE